MENEPPIPDRPLDCSECKRPITVIYTEIIGNSVVRTSMCSVCPELEKRLHGGTLSEGLPKAKEHGAGIACGSCGLALDAVRKGETLGCKECYTVFSEMILRELESKKGGISMPEKRKRALLHVGRSPGKSLTIDPSVRLMALNEALEESLKHEDYEQAARLRDEINELTGKKDEQEKK